MKSVIVGDGVKVYNLSSGKTLPQWLSEKKRAELKKDEEFKRRIELVQDFEFPVCSRCSAMCADGKHFVATGVYPPSIRVFDLQQLSLKFDRRVEFEATDLQVLSDDWTKIAILAGTERAIQLHAAFGSYHTVRVPKPARKMCYAPSAAELCVCGVGENIWRLNLEQGRFLAPFQSRIRDIDRGEDPSDFAFNTGAVSSVHGLLCYGTDNGMIECFDPRTRLSAAVLKIVAPDAAADDDMGISQLKFDEDGLTLGVGVNSGHCMLYDIRTSAPYMHKYHQNGSPILGIHFHRGGDGRARVLTVDKMVVKAWEKQTGEGMFAIEAGGEGEIASLCPVSPQSGLFFLTGEQKRMQVLYVPALGPAPQWCSFLDNLTEELEEAAPNIYADFKFVTREELGQLGLDRLIGTQYLRAYMHGFFVDMRMYKKVKEVVDPFAYDQYRKEAIQKKLDEQAKTRIFAKTALPKVNPELAKRMMDKEKTKKGTTALSDDRFAAMFTNPDFAITGEEQYKFGGKEAPVKASRMTAAQREMATEEDGIDYFEEDDADIKEIEDRFAPVVDNDDMDDDENMFEVKSGQSALATLQQLMPGKRSVFEKEQARQQKKRALANASAKVQGMELGKRASLERKRKERLDKYAGGTGLKIIGEGSGLVAGEREITFIPAEPTKKRKRDN